MKVPIASFSGRRPVRERTFRRARPLAVPSPIAGCHPARETMQITVNQPIIKLTNHQINPITIILPPAPNLQVSRTFFLARPDSNLATNPILLLNFARS